MQTRPTSTRSHPPETGPREHTAAQGAPGERPRPTQSKRPQGPGLARRAGQPCTGTCRAAAVLCDTDGGRVVTRPSRPTDGSEPGGASVHSGVKRLHDPRGRAGGPGRGGAAALPSRAPGASAVLKVKPTARPSVTLCDWPRPVGEAGGPARVTARSTLGATLCPGRGESTCPGQRARTQACSRGRREEAEASWRPGGGPRGTPRRVQGSTYCPQGPARLCLPSRQCGTCPPSNPSPELPGLLAHGRAGAARRVPWRPADPTSRLSTGLGPHRGCPSWPWEARSSPPAGAEGRCPDSATWEKGRLRTWLRGRDAFP